VECHRGSGAPNQPPLAYQSMAGSSALSPMRGISTYRSIIVNIDIYPLAQHYRYNLLYSVKSDLVQFIAPMGSAAAPTAGGH